MQDHPLGLNLGPPPYGLKYARQLRGLAMHLETFRTSSSPPKQALLVQPDATERRSLILPFEKFGYRVMEATSRFSALRIVDSSPLDVVVDDLELSEADDLALAKQVRARRDRVFPSLVAVTALPLTPQRVLDAEMAGYDLIVEKSNYPWQFVVRIDQLVRRSRALRESSSQQKVRAVRLSAQSELIRSRAQEAVAQSQEAISHASVVRVVGRILTTFLNKPDITMTLGQAVDVLEADAGSCQRALEALVRSGFLESTSAGYRRREW